MSEFSSVLKMYAESGLRTVEGWVSLGRNIMTDAKPRLDTPYRGAVLPLFSRDQTQRMEPRPKRR